ncbi:MAG TPA: aldose epimerase family protein [Bryobacteraceae bacterium]|nr:aldose epimerase family protein [Bryobacteraceae bacterium]
MMPATAAGLAAIGFGAIFLLSCGSKETSQEVKEPPKTMSAKSRPFGKTRDGEAVELYTLANAKGMEATIMTYGGIVTSLRVPDRNGKPDDVVLGFDSLDGYLGDPPAPYFGALIGRYGNRIGKARFTLNGTEYKLAANNNKVNHLHGGLKGFDKVVWKAASTSPQSLELTYLSKDGEEGYPGNLTTTVTYTVTDNNELKLEYKAATDKDTVLNLTNHSYFNLAGQGEGDILAHRIMINADKFTPVDATLIPTGELRNVEGTPFDFRKPRPIGEKIDSAYDQTKLGGGYDHNFVLNTSGSLTEPAVRVTEPKSGRVMEVLTTQPGVQFYTGNFLDGRLKGKGGKVYNKRYGFCLETQHFPDSPNQPGFPPVVLKPGEQYQNTTIYRFSADSSK